MKFILCGKGDVAIRALDAMLRAGDQVWAVGTAGDDGRDGWQRSFRAAAEGAGVRFDRPRRINDEHFTQRLAAFGKERESLGLALIEIDELNIHPDGTWIALQLDREVEELWAMENLLSQLRVPAGR